MQIAILTVSSLSLAVGVINLAIMAKTARELKNAKTEVESLKAKLARNAGAFASAIKNLEF